MCLNVGFGFDVIGFEFAKQGALIDAEALCCGFSVALGSPQCLDDEKNFHLFEGFYLTDRYGIQARARTNGRRQMLPLYDFALAQDKTMLNYVLKLPDVSGIIMTQQSRQHIIRNTTDVPVA